VPGVIDVRRVIGLALDRRGVRAVSVVRGRGMSAVPGVMFICARLRAVIVR
jgi:hypothetical protein